VQDDATEAYLDFFAICLPLVPAGCHRRGMQQAPCFSKQNASDLIVAFMSERFQPVETPFSSMHIQKLHKRTSSEGVRQGRPSNRTLITETTNTELCTKLSCSQPDESVCPSRGSGKTAPTISQNSIRPMGDAHCPFCSHDH